MPDVTAAVSLLVLTFHDLWGVDVTSESGSSRSSELQTLDGIRFGLVCILSVKSDSSWRVPPLPEQPSPLGLVRSDRPSGHRLAAHDALGRPRTGPTGLERALSLSSTAKLVPPPPVRKRRRRDQHTGTVTRCEVHADALIRCAQQDRVRAGDEFRPERSLPRGRQLRTRKVQPPQCT